MPDPDDINGDGKVSPIEKQVGKVRTAGRNVLNNSAPVQVAKAAGKVPGKTKKYVSDAGSKIKKGLSGMFQ